MSSQADPIAADLDRNGVDIFTSGRVAGGRSQVVPRRRFPSAVSTYYWGDIIAIDTAWHHTGAFCTRSALQSVSHSRIEPALAYRWCVSLGYWLLVERSIMVDHCQVIAPGGKLFLLDQPSPSRRRFRSTAASVIDGLATQRRTLGGLYTVSLGSAMPACAFVFGHGLVTDLCGCAALFLDKGLIHRPVVLGWRSF